MPCVSVEQCIIQEAALAPFKMSSREAIPTTTTSATSHSNSVLSVGTKIRTCVENNKNSGKETHRLGSNSVTHTIICSNIHLHL
jgi:hypothetical protein